MGPKKKKAVNISRKITPSIKYSNIVKDTTIPVIPSSKGAVLLTAAGMGDSETLLRLVKHYNYQNDMSSLDGNGSTLIHIATKRGDVDLLRKLVDYKEINKNACEKRSIGGYTAVHYACASNNISILYILLHSGANPNINSDSESGETPLHLCCRLGYVACAKLLLEFGASVNAKDNYGNNPSFWAHAKQFDSMITTLKLPPPKSSTPEEYLQMMRLRNPLFRVPPIVVKSKQKQNTSGSKKERSRSKSPAKSKRPVLK